VFGSDISGLRLRKRISAVGCRIDAFGARSVGRGLIWTCCIPVSEWNKKLSEY